MTSHKETNMFIIHWLLFIAVATASPFYVGGCKKVENPPIEIVIGLEGDNAVVYMSAKTTECNRKILYQFTTLDETIDNIEFHGLMAEGYGETIKVLAAKLPDQDVARVIADSTQPLVLHCEKIVSDDKKIESEMRISSGKQDVLLALKPKSEH